MSSIDSLKSAILEIEINQHGHEHLMAFVRNHEEVGNRIAALAAGSQSPYSSAAIEAWAQIKTDGTNITSGLVVCAVASLAEWRRSL
ncbi:hypothetical protein [Saccharopolyspora taberi]|uniref:Uncharacterized protein n=1 Tax=Saccharopolyspora taberi TaxID=60895 RepID=A0ABN3V1P9_9PSEU